MKKYHCYTVSGSRYSFRVADDGHVFLEGEATARTHERGETKGMVKGKEYPVHLVLPWPPQVKVGLLIHYVPDDLDEGTDYREKLTSAVERIEVENGEPLNSLES